VVNNGRITNKGLSRVPALTTVGSVTIINHGVISGTVTVTNGKTAKAVGVWQKN
jgi:hypothetical protein